MRISDWISYVCSSDLGIIDELGLVDDAVDFLMLAHEAEEGAKPGMLGGDFVGRGLDDRGDIIPQLLTHIADQRLENRLFRIEISIETAERGAGAAGNAADRRFVKAAVAELDRRRVEQFAQRPPSPLGARRLVAAAPAGQIGRAHV